MCSKPNLTLPHLLALSDSNFLTFIFSFYNLIIPLHNRHKSTDQTNEKKRSEIVCVREGKNNQRNMLQLFYNK